MLNIQAKRHIRFATIEQLTQWVVVAVVLETRGTETIAITEPKVVKVIPKAVKAALASGYASHAPYLLTSLQKPISAFQNRILSPYVPAFGYAQSNSIMWLLAQPPTK